MSDPSVTSIVVPLVAFVALLVIGAPVYRRVVDRLPAPLHRALDWLGLCERHPS